LVSSVYFGHDVIWFIPPDQKVDTNNMTSAIFGQFTADHKFSSALIYKLQRKRHAKSNNQFNADNALTEVSSTNVQLLVIWKYDAWDNEFSVCALLIKHGSTIIWDAYKLEKLHSIHLALLNKDLFIIIGDKYGSDLLIEFKEDPFAIEDTWLLNDATVLVTSKWKKESRTFEIAISKGTRKDDIMEPLWASSTM
jgi:hypothetical protein